MFGQHGHTKRAQFRLELLLQLLDGLFEVAVCGSDFLLDEIGPLLQIRTNVAHAPFPASAPVQFSHLEAMLENPPTADFSA
jgi:hypothetical protein